MVAAMILGILGIIIKLLVVNVLLGMVALSITAIAWLFDGTEREIKFMDEENSSETDNTVANEQVA